MPEAIPIDRTQIQMTIPSAPSAAGRVYGNAPQTKAWAEFPRPFGPKPAPKSDRLLGQALLTLRAKTPGNS